MSRSLYIRFAGKITGPISIAEAQSLLKNGKLGSLHQLSSDRVSWFSAREAAARFEVFACVSATEESDQPPSKHRKSVGAESPKASGTSRIEDLTEPNLADIAIAIERSSVKDSIGQRSHTTVRHTARPSPPPNQKRNSRGILIAGSVICLLFVMAGGILIYKSSSEEANRKAEFAKLMEEVERAGRLIEQEDYSGAKNILEASLPIAKKYAGLQQHATEIEERLQSPEIVKGANGFRKVDGAWMPEPTAIALRDARRRDDPVIKALEQTARKSMANRRFSETKSDCQRALNIIAAHPVNQHPRMKALTELLASAQALEVEVEMTAKGLVLHENKWVTPDEKFRLEQHAKGLVEYQGKWVSKEEAFAAQQTAKGFVLYQGQWVTPDEKKEKQGFIKFEGQWLTADQKARIIAGREAEAKRQSDALIAEMERRKAVEENERRLAIKMEGLKKDAYMMSQEFLKDTLKSPASARFQPYGSRHVSVSFKDGWFHVVAVVDADNAFGASLRKTYVSKLKPLDDEGKWRSELTTLIED